MAMTRSRTVKIPQKDHLSNLPPELLVQIFRDVLPPMIEGLSRSLLPYTQSILYQNVRILDIQQFKQFMRTVVNSPSIGSQIEELNIEVGRAYSASEDELSVLEAILFFRNLNRVQVMTLNFTWLITILSSLSVATTSLPLLNDLSITTPPFLQRSDSWEFESFKKFNFYPSLQTLRLKPFFTFHESQETPEVNQWIAINGDVSDQITRLDNRLREEEPSQAWKESREVRRTHLIKILYIEVISSDYELSLMISKLSGIKKLYITDSNCGPYIFDVLGKLLNPAHLNYLKLHIKSQSKQTSTLNIQSQLVKYKNFTTLKLSAYLSHPSEIFKFLRDPLPLTSLSLGYGTEVNIKELRSLILPGCNKLSSLKTLRLDVVGGKISKDRVEEIGEAYYGRHNQDPARPYPGWKVPAWKEGTFDEKGLIGLMRLANDAGIEVIGSSVKAIGIYEAYVEECEIADEYDEERCTEEGDSDCTDCFESDDWDEESF